MTEMQLIKAGWKFALTVYGPLHGSRNQAIIKLAIGNDTPYHTLKLHGATAFAVYTRK